MKCFTSKLLIFIVFFLALVTMAQSADAMGLNPWRHEGSGGQGGTQGVPEPLTTLSLLGVGVIGAGTYLFIRKKKDK